MQPDYDVLIIGSGFGGSVTALRLTEKGYRVGVLEPVSLQANSANMEQFRKGLRDAGYAEGGNLSIEYLSAEGNVFGLDESVRPGLLGLRRLRL